MAFIIIKNDELRPSTKCFFLNLVSTDMLLLLVMVPANIVATNTSKSDWFWGKEFCKFVMFNKTFINWFSFRFDVKTQKLWCRHIERFNFRSQVKWNQSDLILNLSLLFACKNQKLQYNFSQFFVKQIFQKKSEYLMMRNRIYVQNTLKLYEKKLLDYSIGKLA